MKINEAEQLLGITKANIRFYEKEGLLSPSRNESGYRDYSGGDIALLKQIVILRKLGIPVQKIGDILDGALPLQDALEENITSLNAQIEALNGALALTNQLRQENEDTLDTERYWELIRNQESQGLRFQELVDDYLKFTELNYEFLLWPLPGDALRSPWEVAKFIIGFGIVTALLKLPLGEPFLPTFLHQLAGSIGALVLWTAIFVPIYLLRRRKPKLAKWLMNFLLAAAMIAMFLVPIIAFLYVAATP
jgi:DNA-binding transcriptional MerR regulator